MPEESRESRVIAERLARVMKVRDKAHKTGEHSRAVRYLDALAFFVECGASPTTSLTAAISACNGPTIDDEDESAVMEEPAQALLKAAEGKKRQPSLMG